MAWASVPGWKGHMKQDASEAFKSPSLRSLSAHPRGGKERAERRERVKLPSLVSTSKGGGRLQVDLVGLPPGRFLRRDWFQSLIELRVSTLILLLSVAYICTWLFFAALYYSIAVSDDRCFENMSNFNAAFVFSISSQTTIGYGTRSISANCHAATPVLVIQMLTKTVIDAFVIGLVYARLSSPLQRKHTIFISDNACIARRDGVLKLMFRLADVRERQVVNPNVKAFLYTWEERITSEGEYVPVRVQPLELEYIDKIALLPVTIEHPINERSPLYGHSHNSLVHLNAEIVVVFEGTVDSTGLRFMVRQSFLPHEIKWGHVFQRVIHQAKPGELKHKVDLARFHEVVPQKMVEERGVMNNEQMSQLVLESPRAAIPYPALTENTLLLSGRAVICRAKDQLRLMVRVGDVGLRPGHPNRTLWTRVRLFLFTWHQSPEHLPTEGVELALRCHGRPGNDLYLRVPVCVEHIIDESSPLYSWTTLQGRLSGLDAELAATVEGTIYAGGPCFTQRVYKAKHVLWGYKFVNVVTPPSETHSGFLDVEWSKFHDVEPMGEALTPPAAEQQNDNVENPDTSGPQLKQPQGFTSRPFEEEESMYQDAIEVHLQEQGETGQSDNVQDENSHSKMEDGQLQNA